MGHKHQTTDAIRIQRLVDDGEKTSTLAKEFGVSKESINGWLKSNSAPCWTKLACEALERRRGKSGKTFVFCTIPGKHVSAFAAIVRSLDGEAHVIEGL